jgi:outer membrane immunogenic protein
MKKYAIAAAVLAFSGTAYAADMPLLKAPPMAAPAFSWTGWYVGLNAGGTFGHDSSGLFVDDSVGRYFTFGAGQALNVATVDAAGGKPFNNRGFTGGGQFGYNLQMNPFVAGAEVDIGYFNPKGSQSVAGVYLPGGGVGAGGSPLSFNQTASGTFLSTFRARLGIPVNNWLFYGTFGGAVANLKFASAFADGTSPPGVISGGLVSNFATSNTRLGFAGGGGIEYAINQNWTLRGEYLLVSFNNVGSTVQANPTNGNLTAFFSSFKYSGQFQEQIARAAINYKL